MKRHEFSQKTRRLAWERSGGRCEGIVDADPRAGWRHPDRCNVYLLPGRYIYDHINPDWFSGCNKLSNCQVICDYCDHRKTARDIKAIAKAKRIRRKADPATRKRPRRVLRSRGFDKTRTRKFSGEVVPRKP